MRATENSNSPGPAGRIWLLALVVSALPVGFALYQVYLFFERTYPAFYWSRTIAAFVAVAFAICGIAAPLLLVVKRAAFVRLPRARQWAALGIITLLVPIGYVMAFGLLLELARNSRPVFSTTQMMTLRHAADDTPPLDFDVPGGMNGRGHGHGSDDGEWVGEWEYWWLPSRLRESDDDPDLRLECMASGGANGVWELNLQFTSDREIVFDMADFVIISASRGGDAVSFPLELDHGSHVIAINARPE